MSSPADGESIEEVAHTKILALRNYVFNRLPAKTGRRIPTTAKNTKVTKNTKIAKTTKSRKDRKIAIKTSTRTEARSSHKKWFADIATKMMFVSGETAEPSPETTTLIEEITRQQVIEIVSTRAHGQCLSSLTSKAYPKHRFGNPSWSSLYLHR